MGKSGLLEQIERDALDDSVPVTSTLRKCIALGGQAGSTKLRDWAFKELHGYEPGDDVPKYRIIHAPLQIDGMTFGGHVTGQTIRPGALPEPTNEHIKEEVTLVGPLAAIAESIQVAEKSGERVVRYGPPGGSDIVALMNYENQETPQHIERIYWAASISSLAKVLDVVRTNLVALVAEIRAALPEGAAKATQDAADQAVNVIIHGDKNRVHFRDVWQAGSGNDMGVGPKRRHGFWWWTVRVSGALIGLAGVVLPAVAMAT